MTWLSTRPAPIVPIPAMKKGTATWKVVWYHFSFLYGLLPKLPVSLRKSGSGSEFATEEMVTTELPLEIVPPPRLDSDMSVLFFWPLGFFRPAIEKSIYLTLNRTTFQRHLTIRWNVIANYWMMHMYSFSHSAVPIFYICYEFLKVYSYKFTMSSMIRRSRNASLLLPRSHETHLFISCEQTRNNE